MPQQNQSMPMDNVKRMQMMRMKKTKKGQKGSKRANGLVNRNKVEKSVKRSMGY